MPVWLTDILAVFGDAWVAWVVVASSVLVYALMTLTLRASEPRELADRLSLAHGQVSGDESVDDVLNYRSMRIVLTTFRTASVMVFVMGSMNVILALGGELTFGTLVLLGAGIVFGLIVLRALLNRLADGCYDDVEMWLAPLAWIARGFGKLLPFRRFATNSYYKNNGSESSPDREDNILTVARNLAAEDVRAEDLMVPVTEVVAVKRGMRMDEMRQLLLTADSEFAVVCGDSINEVLGTARASDVLRSMLEDEGAASSSDSVLRPVLKLTPTQQFANVVEAFRGREDQTGIVIGEDGKFVGTLTYSRLMRRLFSNGVAKQVSGE